MRFYRINSTYLLAQQLKLMRYVDFVHSFVFQYLTTMKLTSGYAFNYIVLRLLPYNWLKSSNFTICHVVYFCGHSNHNGSFPNLLFLFLKMSHVDLFIITKTRLFKYIEIITNKKGKFSDKKKPWYFSYFCSKHKLWVLVRTASARRF